MQTETKTVIPGTTKSRNPVGRKQTEKSSDRRSSQNMLFQEKTVPAPFRGLASPALTVPEIPESFLCEFEDDGEIFHKIFHWLNRDRERCRRFGGESVPKAILRSFRESTMTADGYFGLIEDFQEAFCRIDNGGYLFPDDDLQENWFAITFLANSEDVFVSRDGNLRKKTGLAEALRWIRAYSLVPIFDFQFLSEQWGICFHEERLPVFETLVPGNLRHLSPPPELRRIPMKLKPIHFADLRDSFQTFRKVEQNWTSIRLSEPVGAMPRFLLRMLDESNYNEHDIMREAWDTYLEDIQQESEESFGFFQIGVDLRTADPDLLLRMISAVSWNFSAQKQIMIQLEETFG